MFQSHLFTKTRKDAPKDEVSKNAQLLIRAGYIHKEMAGVYSYLPLGLRALNKINTIIREEMNAIGGMELFLSSLQEKSVWEKTNRWDDAVVDNWFKTELKNETEVGLGFTHEEPITRLMKEHIRSFRDLPVAAYQIQTKFRNEARAKSGIMRGREFLMKDLYSFAKDEAEHQVFYEKCKQAYKNIFNRAGIGEKTYLTYASGGSFSKYSHEFQTVSEAGEDTIYICEKCKIAVNDEIIKEQSVCPECKNDKLVSAKSIEVGNIFSLGTKFSDAFELSYSNEKGESKSVVMGSYGIGPGRLMGTIVELFADEKGICWPKGASPFDFHIVALNTEDEEVLVYALSLYKKLKSSGKTVLLDDRTLRGGEKFADSDLIGVPIRIVVSKKTLESKELEIKDRKSGKTAMVSEEMLLGGHYFQGE